METFQGKRIICRSGMIFLEKVHSHLIKLIIVLQNPLRSFPFRISAEINSQTKNSTRRSVIDFGEGSAWPPLRWGGSALPTLAAWRGARWRRCLESVAAAFCGETFSSGGLQVERKKKKKEKKNRKIFDSLIYSGFLICHWFAGLWPECAFVAV